MRFRFRSTAASVLLAFGVVVSLFWVSRSLSQQKGPDPFGLRAVGPSLSYEYLPTMRSSARKPAIRDLSAERFRGGADDEEGSNPSYLFSSVFQDKLRVLGENWRRDRSIQILNIGIPNAPPHPHSRFRSPMALSEEANFLFSASFRELFASVFGVNRLDEASVTADNHHPEEVRNPFTEALRQSDDKSATLTPPASPSRAESKKSTETKNTADPVAATGSPPDAGFFFLGDWDGSGLLRLVSVRRLNETTFAFPDSRRSFSLFVNPSAVEEQRSVAIEDITGDGNEDLLVTSRASLFGGVLMGDGKGNFVVLDTFLSGYEPVVATAGSFRGVWREILATNVRTGIVSVFRAADRFRFFREFDLGFIPDYVGHLVEQAQGSDYFMAAQVGSPSWTFQLRDESLRGQSEEGLPAEPGLTSTQFFSGTSALPGVLQVYQAGTYASVVLSNARGERFNVANLKVSPRVFLVIGDLDNNGTADVAVAYLK